MKPRQTKRGSINHDSFEDLCRARGLALTSQRRVIFAAIADRRDHPTADTVYEAVRDRLPGVSRTTVYRVLETLVRAGAITKACHPGSAARYDPLIHRHHHLVCMRCEKVIDIEDDQLDALPLPRVSGMGFEISDFCVHFRGVCADCRTKNGGRTARRNQKKKAPRRSPARKPSKRSER